MAYQKNAGAVRRFSWLMKFAAWLQNIPNRLTPPPFRLIQIGSAFWQSRVLYLATRMDIATVLGDESLTAAVIAERVGASQDACRRLLRMLAAMGIFEEVEPGVFRNNRLSVFLRDDNPKNVRAMIMMHNSEAMSRPWYEQLERGVREGEPPFSLVHGEDLFEYMDHHADFDALFSRAMDCVESLSGDSFATDFDWGRFGRIIDVGGSRGTKSLAILKRHPGITALVVDRAQVIEDAVRYWNGCQAAGLDRVRFEACDMLESVPRAKDERDVYLLAAILHGFGDDNAVRILGNLRNACTGTGARIALLEQVMPVMHADLVGASFDMQMFMGTRGRERTLLEWNDLFDRSGLVLEEVVGLQSFGNVLVLRACSPFAG